MRVRSRFVHDFRTCKENAASQCRFPIFVFDHKIRWNFLYFSVCVLSKEGQKWVILNGPFPHHKLLGDGVLTPVPLLCLICTTIPNKTGILDQYLNTPQVLTTRSFLVAGFDTRWVPKERFSAVYHTAHHINRVPYNCPREMRKIRSYSACPGERVHDVTSIVILEHEWSLIRDFGHCGHKLNTSLPHVSKINNYNY